MTHDNADVLAANQAFYAAFRDRSLEAMDRLWARQTNVAVIHPGWAAIAGREQVMSTWASILTSPASPEIHCSEAVPFITGDTAFVICTEAVSDGTLVATNIFVREDGVWRIVHHQAGPGRGLTPPERPPPGLLH